MKNKTTIALETEDNSGLIQITKIDNSTKYKDFMHSIKYKRDKETKILKIKNYSDENGLTLEINDVLIYGEHLELLKQFLNQ